MDSLPKVIAEGLIHLDSLDGPEQVEALVSSTCTILSRKADTSAAVAVTGMLVVLFHLYRSHFDCPYFSFSITEHGSRRI